MSVQFCIPTCTVLTKGASMTEYQMPGENYVGRFVNLQIIFTIVECFFHCDPNSCEGFRYMCLRDILCKNRATSDCDDHQISHCLVILKVYIWKSDVKKFFSWKPFFQDWWANVFSQFLKSRRYFCLNIAVENILYYSTWTFSTSFQRFFLENLILTDINRVVGPKFTIKNYFFLWFSWNF